MERLVDKLETIVGEYKGLLASMLGEKRLAHCANAAFVAYELAVESGEDGCSAFKAALVHDIAKEMTLEEQTSWAEKSPVAVPEYAYGSRHRLHGFAAAGYLFDTRKDFSAEELEAIAFHTIGRPDMVSLDMIVYCADKIEPGRGDDYAHYLPLWKSLVLKDRGKALPSLTAAIMRDLIEKNKRRGVECPEGIEINKRLVVLLQALETRI